MSGSSSSEGGGASRKRAGGGAVGEPEAKRARADAWAAAVGGEGSEDEAWEEGGGSGGRGSQGSVPWSPGRRGGADLGLVQRRLQRLLKVALEGAADDGMARTDATFVLDDGSKVHGHRWVMAVGSEYLWTCFSSGLQESQDGVLRVRECSRGTFVALMSFLYTGSAAYELHVGADGGELLRLGALWGVEGLREWAMKSLDGRDVCAAVQYGMDTEDKELVGWGVEAAAEVSLGEMSVQSLKGVRVAAVLKVLEKHPGGKGTEGLCVVTRWWEGNGGPSGWAREEDCRELAGVIDIKAMSSSELRKLLGKPWLFEAGIVEGVLEGREGGGWGPHSRFVEESSFAHWPGHGGVFLPEGIALFEDGGLCVIDGLMSSAARVACYRADGTFSHDFQPGQMSKRLQIVMSCVRPGADTVYIASDYGQHRIGVHQRDGTLIRSFGNNVYDANAYDTADSPNVSHCTGLAVSREGEAFVSTLDEVLVYGEDGGFLRVLWKDDLAAERNICGIAVSPRDGSIVVVRRTRPQNGEEIDAGGLVVVLNTEEVVQRAFGEGILQEPSALAVSEQDEVIISDSGKKKVCILSPEGELLQEFGGAGGALSRPTGVAVRADRRILVADHRAVHVMSAVEPLPTQGSGIP